MEITKDEIRYYFKHIYSRYDVNQLELSEWKEIHDKVNKWWCILSVKEQGVLKLLYDRGHTIEEVANMYNIHISTVYRIIDRAIEKIYLIDD